ncbi:MAG: AAA family ATPase, partial [Deltaproteobacteria bacterium]|nr:AAA family ATPase [Deltaproteobacteria bacterium]
MAERTGRQFAGTDRFVVRRTLGVGGMGVVHEAWDSERNQTVALKTLRKVDPAALYRFKREFRVLADVAHPNLVHLHEFVAEGENWFFTMERVLGVDLLQWVGHRTWPGAETQTGMPSKYLAGSGSQPPVHPEDDWPSGAQRDAHSENTASPPEVLAGDPTPDPAGFLRAEETVSPRILRNKVRLAEDPSKYVDHERLRHALRQLADGVAALHGLGLLHRDIKPSNIMVTPEGRLVLLDLGLVTMMAPAEASVERYVAGTGAYMSPEQAAAKTLDEGSDWYSVGVVLYEALTGVRPFRGTFEEVIRAKQFAEPPPPSRVVPGVPADLDALCTDLLRTHPEERPSGSDILERLGTPPVPPGLARVERAGDSGGAVFVGRLAELDLLRRLFRRAASGHASSVHLHGDSGMGKSALLRRFVDEVSADAATVVLSGRCYERESMPYKAIDAVVDSLSRFLRSIPAPRVEVLLPRDVHALARVFPVLRQVEAIALAPGRAIDAADPQQLRQRAFAALREFLGRIADRHPLVVAIDDLQWGDLDSVQLLLALTRPPENPSLMLLVSYRTDEITEQPHLVALRKEHGLPVTDAFIPLQRSDREPVHDVVLAPLSADDAVRLAQGLVGSTGDPRARAVAAESRGSPFFVQELARYVLERDRAERDDDSGGAWFDGADTAALDLPSGEWLRAPIDEDVKLRLSEVLRERVEALPEDARVLLETVAVAGRPLPRHIARRAAEIDDREAPAVLLLRKENLVRSRGSGEDSAIEPYHDRIREAVLATLPMYRLKERHLRLALALEGSRQADPEALTEHFCGAGHLERAGEYAERAAEQASEALAFDRASMLYRMALQLRGDDAGDALHRLRSRLALALANAGRGVEASTEYGLASELTTGAEALEHRRLAAEHLLRSGHFEDGVAALRGLLQEVGMKLPHTPRAALASLLARRARVRLRGLNWSEREEAELPARERFRADLCWSIAAGLAMVDPIRGADFQTRSLLLALDGGEPRRVARALAMEGAYSAVAGGKRGVVRAFKLFDEAQALAARLDDPVTVALVTSSRGVTLYETGQWAEARRELGAAEEMLVDRCTGVSWELATTRHFLCLTLEMMGELDALARRVPEYVREAEERGDRFSATSFRNGNLNIAWLLRDDPEGARRAYAEAMAPWWGTSTFLLQHYEGLYAQVGIDLYVGDGGSAWLRIEDAWGPLKKSGLLNIQQLKLEALFLRGRAALAALIRPEPAPGPGLDRDAGLARSGTDVLPSESRLLQAAARAANQMEKEKMAWAQPLAGLLRAAVFALQEKPGKAAQALTSSALRLDELQMPVLA